MSIEHTYAIKDGHETKVITKAKAIRLKCLDCSGFQPGEVAKCTCVDCQLYPFRFGNEKGLDRVYVEGQETEDETDEEAEWEDEVANEEKEET